MKRHRGISIAKIDSAPQCEGCPFRRSSCGFTQSTGPLDAALVLVGQGPGASETREGYCFAGQSGGFVNTLLDRIGFTRLDVFITNVIQCRCIEYLICQPCNGKGFIGPPCVACGGQGYHTQTLAAGIEHEETCEYCDGRGVFISKEACPRCTGTGQIPNFLKNGDFVNATPSDEQVVECMERHTKSILNSLKKKRLIVALGEPALYGLTGKRGVSKRQGTVIESPYGPVLISFHPAYAMRKQSVVPVVRRTFSKIPDLLANLDNPVETKYFPTVSDKQIQHLRGRLCVDLETTYGGNPTSDDDQILIASVSPGIGTSYGLSLEQLRSVLERTTTVVGQNFTIFDAWWLYKKGFPVPKRIIDTLHLAHLANPATPNNLPNIVADYAVMAPKEFWKDEEAYSNDLVGVALRDTDYTLRALAGLEKYLRSTDQWTLAEENLIPLAYMSFDFRKRGVRTDPKLLRTREKKADETARKLGKALSEEFGIDLPKKTKTGLPSHPVLQKFLYEKMKLPLRYRWDKGQQKVTTNEQALNSLFAWTKKHGREAEHNFLKQYQAALVFATEAKDLRKYEVEEGDRIHSKLMIGRMDDGSEKGGTATGRLSYQDPSLHQTMPLTRQCFIPDDGYVFLEADASQLEYMIALYFAEEFKLLKRALVDGMDFHQMTMDMTDLIRLDAKRLNFAYFFGGTFHNLAEKLAIADEAAEAVYRRMDQMVPGYKHWKKRIVQFVKANGYWQTEFGWRRFFDWGDRQNTDRGHVIRMIVNTPIQSDAALAVRYKLVQAYRELPKHTDIMLTVHDSMLVQTPDDPRCIREAAECLRDIMTGAVKQLPCPEIGMGDGLRFRCDVSVGRNWGEMRKIDFEKELVICPEKN